MLNDTLMGFTGIKDILAKLGGAKALLAGLAAGGGLMVLYNWLTKNNNENLNMIMEAWKEIHCIHEKESLKPY